MNLPTRPNKNIVDAFKEKLPDFDVNKEIILTEKQAQHIIDEHLEFYKYCRDKIKSALNSPDIISIDKEDKNRLCFLKYYNFRESQVKGKYIKVVLEISKDNNPHKIITGYNENSISSDVIFTNSFGHQEEDKNRIIFKTKKGNDEIKKYK